MPALDMVAPLGRASIVNGALSVPPASKAGWWDRSAKVDSTTGRAVIAGHMDSTTQYFGGVLSPIRNAKVGQRAYITTAGGLKYAFVVTKRYQVDKDRLPADPFYGTDGPLKISMITCGGNVRYDPKQGRNSHEDNIVVELVRA